MSRVAFLNTQVDNLTMDEAIDKAEELIIKKKPSYVVTPNVDHIVKLETDKEFQDVYKNADLILTDGMPLIWISKMKGNPIKEKISGSDFFPKLCERASEKGYSLFLLGAAEGVAAKAAKNLKEKYNGKKIKIDVNVEAIQPNEEALIKKWTGINEKIKDKYVEILSK